MKLIVITSPVFWEGEAEAICTLFREGLEILHLRKPEASADEIRHLLREIPAVYHPRIVIHEHFDLLKHHDLKGIHLNRRNPRIPTGWKGHVSCSCHSLQEVKERKAGCEYVFLSPIYDSISKEGYSSAFQPDELRDAARRGIIDHQVMALGGIQGALLPEVKSMGFGGAALLGDVWKRSRNGLADYFNQLKQYL